MSKKKIRFTGTKQICTHCGIEKEISLFEWNPNRPNPRKICKDCRFKIRYWENPESREKQKERHRRYSRERYATIDGKSKMKENWIRTMYGVGDWKMIAQEQNFKCCICGEILDMGKKTTIDHCHKTNKFRGILCSKCNFGLGFFRDNIYFLQSAIVYLKTRGFNNDKKI